jgi:6-phosphogluconolactonase
VRFSEGIEHLVFDSDSGSVRHVGSTTGDLINPQYVAAHPTLPVLYAAEYRRPGRLASFAVRPDGTLERQSMSSSLGELAVAVTVHPAGRFAYVAHWGDGTLAACRLDGEGRVIGVEPIGRGDSTASSGDPSRHHQVRVTPSGNALLLTDIGRDEVTAYAADRDGAIDPLPISRVGLPRKSGPRHIEFHPSGHLVFVIDERIPTLHVLAAENEVPTRVLGSYSTVPPGYSSPSMPSELHLHPDGRTLYVGNRGFDSITTFSVDDSGRAETLGYQSSFGQVLSSIKVDPTGRYLLAGNMMSGTLVVFEIDGDRQLCALGEPIAVPAPRSFVFVKSQGVAAAGIGPSAPQRP